MTYKIKLELFEGPLDLLLHLIKEDELNIYDIPITRITAQYLEYIHLMQTLDLEIAGEFLVMAATLMQIKSRMLLPADPTTVETEEEDPRAELIRRLLEYKAFKDASQKLRIHEAKRTELFNRVGVEPEFDAYEKAFSEVSLFDLMSAFTKVLKNMPRELFHQVVKDEFTVAEKVYEISHELLRRPKIYFSELFSKAKNKFEMITIFLAVLELVRLREIVAAQSDHFGEIEIQKNSQKTREHDSGAVEETQSNAISEGISQ